MSEPIGRDALMGADGTQLPDPMPVLPDALTGPGIATERDVDVVAPLRLPSGPDAGAIQEAITAALADEPSPLPSTRRPGPPPLARPTVRAQPAARSRPHGPQPPGAHPPGLIAPARPPLLRRIAPSAAPLSHQPPKAGPPSAYDPAPPSGKARAGCVVGLIIFGVIAFSIIAELIGGIADVFQ